MWSHRLRARHPYPHEARPPAIPSAATRPTHTHTPHTGLLHPTAATLPKPTRLPIMMYKSSHARLHFSLQRDCFLTGLV